MNNNNSKVLSGYLTSNNNEVSLPRPSYPRLSRPSIKSFFENISDEQWQKIIWRKVEKKVRGLQKRIYKATKAGQLSRAKSLTKLLLKSSCSIILNIRRVTQDNSGKRTAGVDKKTYLTTAARRQLAQQLMKMARKGWEDYKARAIRRVYIPKPNGKRRPLGIPTKMDAVIQGIIKTALEPFWEAIFEGISTGFRPGYCPHDAIQAIFNSINRQIKWILDADIKGCFDNIKHDFILAQMKSPKIRRMVKQWLKSGVMEGHQTHQSEAGTPQGGVISPLLANIALDGMERHLKKKAAEKEGEKIAKSLRVVRYADDFVVIHKDLEVIQSAQEWLGEWLAVRGLELSEEKTKIVCTLDGFDFLSFNIRHYLKPKTGYFARKDNGKQAFKTLIKPSKEAIKEHKRELGQVVDRMKGQSQDKLIEVLNPKIQGWTNYYKHVVSSKVFNDVDHWLWHKTYRWGIRRHNNKGRRWVLNKYFRNIKTRTRQFASQTKALINHTGTKIIRFVKVQMGKSVYDGDQIYWAKRLTKGYGEITPSKAKLLKKQAGKCEYCHQAFVHGDKMETHHLKPKKAGGKDNYDNLVLLHRHCHDQYHAQVLKQRHTERRANDQLASPYREMSDLQAEVMGIV